jgi:leader peptidase (prepilin peptidase) / N-methyltransferase
MEFLGAVPLMLQLAVLFGFGVIIGSFLNVVLYRLHTGKSLSGRSHCLSCGKGLCAIELVPLLSYIGLVGRCRGCRSYIPIRYFIVELLSGVLFVLVYLTSADLLTLVLGLTFVAVLILVGVYDLRHLIIPDELVLWLTVVAMLSSGHTLLLAGEPLSFAIAMGAAFLGSLFFYFLWQASSGTWIGFGDVKLAFPLGLMIGASGVFSMIVLAFWAGAIVGVGLLVLQALARRYKVFKRYFGRQMTMKSALPFAPFLIIGFLLVWFFEMNVIDLLSYAS